MHRKLEEAFEGKRVFIIAEVAQAHEGSLGMAHAFIDAIARTGADAVKFQTHIADAESSPDEPWRVKFSLQDRTRYDYWKRMEFTEEQWMGLKQHAEEKGLLFLSSPFSIEAVELLRRVGVAAWKIASGEIDTMPLLEKMMETDLPFLVSTGMSSMAEIDETVNFLKNHGRKLALLQCTSLYPTPPEKIGLNMIPIFKEKYGVPVGLSDHSGKVFAGLGAVALGAAFLEVHVTFSREMFGPDVPASLTIDELAQLVEGARFIKKIIDNPVDKDAIALELSEQKKIFSKSIYARSDINEGELITIDKLTFKKPGFGIPAKDYKKIIGKRALRPIKAGSMIKFEDIEP